MTPIQRTANLRRIAAAAVHIERTRGIPAELTTGQCILESGWLDRCPRNNCFGLKANPDATDFQLLETQERLTDVQLARLRASLTPIMSVGPLEPDRRRRCQIMDRFQVFPDLDACFDAYADLLLKGKYFKDRFAKYREHLDLKRLLTDMSGADGHPPYFTAAGYIDLWTAITNQTNVKLALKEAREA